uniref:LOW QUALITY PROTEIN: uncharacterized protein LOC124044475 n=1 Tax=Oncorhynchus gorbuscha TaxID=8017 RepID=UPI001EAE9765|nr:LOW QUALITY PROTEIN: uncharacterized protein LOC124044475 [Oncorhynchus gorbuscha]
MKYIHLSIYLMLQYFYGVFTIQSLSVSPFAILALCTLPAPVNVTIDSLNFHHVLRWIPGPGTPPGTMYKILHRENNMALQLQHQTNMTNQMLDLKYPKEEYRLCVQASHELLESPVTVITFTPFTQTVIGPPTLSLDGCGNCLVINITLPEMETIQNVYGSTVSFQIDWKRAGETLIKETRTTHLSYMLENLNVGTEYCVRVHTMITTNQKTQPSEWKCAHTSIVEANRVPAVVAGVSVLLIVSGAGLMVLMFVLFYTGFLCKLKTHLPRSLTALVEGYLVTPERIFPDLVSISSEPEQQGKASQQKHTTTERTRTEQGRKREEEDEEEEGGNGMVYMDRDAGLSFDSSSSTIQSQEASGANVALLNVAGHSGGLSFETAAEEEEEVPVGVVVLGGQGQSEVKGELTKVISCLDGDQPRPLGLVRLGGEEEKEMREVEKEMREETSGNVNLFSVTLGALKREEEEHETDVLLGCSKQEQKPLLPIDSLQMTLGLDSMGSQGEIQEDTGLVLSRADCTHKYFEYSDRHAVSCTKTYSDCLVTHTGTVQSHNETEEEEEDFSGYMGHLIWMITWLLQTHSAVCDLPAPVNVTLSSRHFVHELRWDPGSGSPRSVYYRVMIFSSRGGQFWEVVAGCEHVESPLVCNLTKAFSSRSQTYYNKVFAVSGDEVSPPGNQSGFKPIDGTLLDPPVVSVKACGSTLCVNLKPPVDGLWDVYDSFRYSLSIRSSRHGAKYSEEMTSLKEKILNNLAPGREYCVSVRIRDSEERSDKNSSYSQPHCAFTAAKYNADAEISVVLCLLVLSGLLTTTLLFRTGFICLRRHLPEVLSSIQHHEESLYTVPCDEKPCPSVLPVPPSPPSGSTGKDTESEEESETETERSSGGGQGYKTRGITAGLTSHNPLSSSSSSRAEVFLHPYLSTRSLASPTDGLSMSLSNNHPPSGPSQTSQLTEPAQCASRGQDLSFSLSSERDTGGFHPEEESCLDVNLLSVTLGRHEEMKDPEPRSLGEPPEPTTPFLPSDTKCWATEPAITQTHTATSEEEEEEDEEYFGYMRR